LKPRSLAASSEITLNTSLAEKSVDLRSVS
jgi:hypothetical protein